MTDAKLPTIPIVNPHMPLHDLVALARAGEERENIRRLISGRGVELNAQHLTDPDAMLNLQTGDILRLGPGDWHQIEIIDFNEIETGRMRLRLLEARDIALLEEHLPEWDIVKYLSKSLPVAFNAEIAGARDVFKKIIMQPDPKSEWLWKIQPKISPDKIIGVAHLHTEGGQGRQNIWLDRAHRGEGVMQEVMTGINEHAFEHLGVQDIHFKEAFAHAAGAPEIEDLRKKFSSADEGTEHRTQDAPEKSWGLSKKKWQKIKARLKLPTTPPSGR